VIESPLFYAVLTYLPATLGFLGCIRPKIIFPVAIAVLLGISGYSLSAIDTGIEISYKLMWIGGIEFSFDKVHFSALIWIMHITLNSIWSLQGTAYTLFLSNQLSITDSVNNSLFSAGLNKYLYRIRTYGILRIYYHCR
jgi:hypothetical protein